MFYNKKYPENKDKVLLSDIDREDRIEEGFNNVETEFGELHDKIDMVKDYVVDFGSNSNGKWEKWASGKLVQIGSKSGNFSSGYSTHSGGDLYRTSFTSATYPIAFTSVDFVDTDLIAVDGSVGLKLSMGAGDNTKTPDYALQRGTRGDTSVRYIMYFKAIGRWK